MIALVRVDNRLIHGQVVSTWLPHLKAQELLVADEEAAGSSLMQMAMTMAVPPPVEVRIVRPSDVDWRDPTAAGKRTLVLVRDVASAAAAFDAGLEAPDLNLGNVHFAEGRRAVLASVFLSEEELRTLDALAARGVNVYAQAVPTHPKIGLPELWSRYRGGR